MGLQLNTVELLHVERDGAVSSYGHEDIICAERIFLTSNALEGRKKLPDNGGGQHLSQKLEPIIETRKVHQNWELDAWSDWTRIANFGPPDEAIVICVNTSYSMDVPMSPGWTPYSSVGTDPSRADEVKEFFKNLALRISALDLKTYLGLATFSHDTKVVHELSPIVLNFNQSLDEVECNGLTAIFDALNTAGAMLDKFSAEHPQKKRRIILLTYATCFLTPISGGPRTFLSQSL